MKSAQNMHFSFGTSCGVSASAFSCAYIVIILSIAAAVLIFSASVLLGNLILISFSARIIIALALALAIAGLWIAFPGINRTRDSLPA